MSKPKTIDEYLSEQSGQTRELLETVRRTIKLAAPESTEAISYGIPTFRVNGRNMVHFAGFEHHIGLYATPDGHAAFEDELNKYKRGKGSVQFPINQPLPLDLIARIARFRADELTKL